VGVAVGDGTQDQLVEGMGSDYQALRRSIMEPPARWAGSASQPDRRRRSLVLSHPGKIISGGLGKFADLT
jgi:hypothetical protein